MAVTDKIFTKFVFSRQIFV